MMQRGRKSSAALAVVPDEVTGAVPLSPPAGLTSSERGVWLGIVNSKPADYFGTEHIPILVEYSRQVCRGHIIDEQIKAFEPEWMATDDGLRRYEKLIGMAAKIAGVQNTLLRSMRLTHQAVYLKDKASLRTKGKKLWQREQS